MSYKIGLIGLAGAGKDTAAVILQRILAEQGHSFEITRYAALLKEATRLAFGDSFDDRDVKEERVFVTPTLADKMIDATDYIYLKLGFNHDDTFEQFNDLCIKHIDNKTWISPREFQQLLGTEVVRAIDPNAWVDHVRNREGNFIITDARFDNECSDVNLLITRFSDVPRPEHVSEHLAWDLQFGGKTLPVDTINVSNTGTLEELETKLRFAVTLLRLNR